MNSELKKLAELLRKRLEIIADHEFRDNDPESHLKSLEEISVAIENEHDALGNSIDARLKHYLTNMSYEKALRHIEITLAIEI